MKYVKQRNENQHLWERNGLFVLTSFAEFGEHTEVLGFPADSEGRRLSSFELGGRGGKFNVVEHHEEVARESFRELQNQCEA